VDSTSQTNRKLPKLTGSTGKLYEAARLKDHSSKLYQEALATDHFPEAHLALGRLETEQNSKDQARQHILAALNVDRTVGIRTKKILSME